MYIVCSLVNQKIYFLINQSAACVTSFNVIHRATVQYRYSIWNLFYSCQHIFYVIYLDSVILPWYEEKDLDGLVIPTPCHKALRHVGHQVAHMVASLSQLTLAQLNIYRLKKKKQLNNHIKPVLWIQNDPAPTFYEFRIQAKVPDTTPIIYVRKCLIPIYQ